MTKEEQAEGLELLKAAEHIQAEMDAHLHNLEARLTDVKARLQKAEELRHRADELLKRLIDLPEEEPKLVVQDDQDFSELLTAEDVDREMNNDYLNYLRNRPPLV